MDPHAATKKLETLRTLMAGHTDTSEERRILDLLRDATAAELNYLLANVDLESLLGDLDDRIFGPDHHTALLTMLCRERAPQLALPVRASLVTALQRGGTPTTAERALRDMFLSVHGRELTAFKNLLDAGNNHQDLEKLLFDDVDDPALREEILSHIHREGEAAPSGENKVLSDIDDTFFANLKDTRYPSKTVYPGVLAFYAELDRGPGLIPGREGDLTFVTARPMDPLGAVENLTFDTLKKHGVPPHVVLSGSLTHLLGNSRIAAKKFDNFQRYVRVFPEYGFVFVGDSGQGDVEFGDKMLTAAPQAVHAVFIHDVVDTPETARRAWREKRIHFFDTYVGAALEAFALGLISRDGLARVALAARESMEGIAFTSAAQRDARKAELLRDLQRADALTSPSPPAAH
ncbi:phosphatase domain-containing protein [Corallococcus terminator]